MSTQERAQLNIKWKLEKFDVPTSEEANKTKPYEVKECEKDILLHEGIVGIAYLCFGIGSAATKWDNTNARLGVGDTATAPADTQTGLQASTNKAYKGMNASYPQQSGDHDIVFQADFINGEAEFAWNEETIVNASSDTGVNLCRQNTALGTKPSGQTWRLTGTVTFS